MASYVLDRCKITLTFLMCCDTVSDQYNQDVAHWSLAGVEASTCSVEPGTASDVGKIVRRAFHTASKQMSANVYPSFKLLVPTRHHLLYVYTRLLFQGETSNTSLPRR